MNTEPEPDPTRLLLHHLIVVVIVKLLVLTAIWWVFIRDQRVPVDAERAAAAIVADRPATSSTTPE